jgi:SAM-dependent methyltransferase
MKSSLLQQFKASRGESPERRLASSRQFWETKARENAFWYVSSFGPYEGRDPAEFWNAGPKIWSDLKAVLGYVPSPTDMVVEIGCGVGRLTRAIAPEVRHVNALDLSEKMLAIARACPLTNVTFHPSDGYSLRPLATHSASLVLAYCVFQHLPSEAVLGDYLREMVRVAKPSGVIAFTLTPRTWRDRLRPLAQVKRWLKERLRPDGPRDLYRSEWLGIRPRAETVHALSPIRLSQTILHGDKWLFYGLTPAGRDVPVGS